MTPTAVNAGPVGAFVARSATPLRIGVIALMSIILLWLDAPSLATVLVLAVICVVLLLLIETLRASAYRRVDATDPASPAGPRTPSTSTSVSERRLT